MNPEDLWSWHNGTMFVNHKSPDTSRTIMMRNLWIALHLGTSQAETQCSCIYGWGNCCVNIATVTQHGGQTQQWHPHQPIPEFPERVTSVCD